MGLFDWIKCEMPLPEWPEDMSVETFQTKSLPAMCMATYKIAADGYLYLKKEESEWIDDPNDMLGGYFKYGKAEWCRCDEFTGVITFYEYFQHRNYTTDRSEYFEIGHIDYQAKIVNGKVEAIVCSENIEPKELSGEELAKKLADSAERVKEFRQRSIKYRKENPSPTQKLMDDIDNLINNKPAIADQSDYIQIINNIQKLVAGWRETNDPWYEKEV